MRCTRVAVDNQFLKGCGHGYEDTNKHDRKKEAQWVGIRKTVRECMLTLTESLGIW